MGELWYIGENRQRLREAGALLPQIRPYFSKKKGDEKSTHGEVTRSECEADRATGPSHALTARA